MWWTRVLIRGTIFTFLLLTCASLAEASTNAFVEFERWPINGTTASGRVATDTDRLVILVP